MRQPATPGHRPENARQACKRPADGSWNGAAAAVSGKRGERGDQRVRIGREKDRHANPCPRKGHVEHPRGLGEGFSVVPARDEAALAVDERNGVGLSSLRLVPPAVDCPPSQIRQPLIR